MQNSILHNNTIVTFIIPFASRAFAKDWFLSCIHLKQTILSLLNSADSRLAIVVVGNNHPGNSFPSDDRVHFITTPLCGQLAKQRDTTTMAKDQISKMEIGWEYVKKHLPSRYVMRMDSDDLLSRHVVGFLATESGPGYRISDGWIWNDGESLFIEKTEKFDVLCGSSNIFRFDVAEKKFNLQDVCSPIPDYMLAVRTNMNFSLISNRFHQYAGNAMALLNMDIAQVPFKAAVYRVGNVNSEMQRMVKFHSCRQFLGRIRKLRIISQSLKKEFALYPNQKH